MEKVIEMDLSEKINRIDIEINNLKNKKEELLRNEIEPIANKIIKDLRSKRKFWEFTYSVDNLMLSDENYYLIHIRFPNGYTFKERMKVKHKLIEYIHNKTDNDYALSKIMITGII